MSAEKHSADPCGDYGPDQRWAVVWFFSVLIISVFLIRTLRDTDYYNYRTNGEFYDYGAYRSNRIGQTHIQSDATDPRAHGDLAAATKKLGK